MEYRIGRITVTVLNFDQWKEAFPVLGHAKSLEHISPQAHYCKAELLSSNILGTLSVPDHNNLTGPRTPLGFLIQQDKLTLIDDSDLCSSLVPALADHLTPAQSSSSELFLLFLESLVQEDGVFLLDYEQQLEQLEEILLSDIPDQFYQTIIRRRRELLILHSYYQQLGEVADVLEDSSSLFQSGIDYNLSAIFSQRVDRLHHHVEMLREYVLQIREMYQSQLNIAQNRIMTILTIVTTIFLPLTLLVGWYGMNFINMPELHWKYGYLAVSVVSLLILLVELYLFHKKNLFGSKK